LRHLSKLTTIDMSRWERTKDLTISHGGHQIYLTREKKDYPDLGLAAAGFLAGAAAAGVAGAADETPWFWRRTS
jgi:hypothetical protein